MRRQWRNACVCKDWLASLALPLCRFGQKSGGERYGRESLDFPSDCLRNANSRPVTDIRPAATSDSNAAEAVIQVLDINHTFCVKVFVNLLQTELLIDVYQFAEEILPLTIEIYDLRRQCEGWQRLHPIPDAIIRSIREIH